jgi:hypothetical protein
LWRAVDETLERPVSVRVVRPGHRHTADVIDAARRAALVEDTRLVRVLDVGESGGSAYIVSEHLVGHTINELLASGPLPHRVARRLIGEAAEALDRASARGLHHLLLTPSSLVVTTNGSIKVLGTAVEAALAGIEHHEDPLGADRADTAGLVQVLYAALTGQWPRHTNDPLAPRGETTKRVVPPGDLLNGIPNDLDTLCTVTLGPHDDGPRSPRELAQQLAPWPPAEPMPSPSDKPSPSSPRPTGLGISNQPTSTNRTGSGVVSTRAGRDKPAATDATAQGRTAGKKSAAVSLTGVDPESGTKSSDEKSSDEKSSAPRSSHTKPASTGPPVGAKVVRHGTPARGIFTHPEPALPTLLPRDTATMRPASGSSVVDVPAAARPGFSNTGSTRDIRDTGSTVNDAKTRGPLTGKLRLFGSDPQADDWALLSRSAPGSSPQQTQSEPIGPFIPPAPISRPSQDQTRFVLTVVAGLVALGLVLAVISLHGLFESSDPLVEPPHTQTGALNSPSRSAAAAPAPSTTPPDASTAGTSPSGESVEISGIQAIDPQGDGDEYGSTADLAIDGNPSTSWHSARYQSAEFGGLKQGLGLYLQVSGGPITSVTVQFGGHGGAVELRTANGPGLDGSAVVATTQQQAGPVVLTPTTPLTNGPLLLWFTHLPQQDSGEYRGEYRLVVSEITVS